MKLRMSSPRRLTSIIQGVVMMVAAALFMMALVTHVAISSEQYNITQAVSSTLMYIPGAPNWNQFNPHPVAHYEGAYDTFMPLAFYNPITNQFFPGLADNWTIQVLPNGSGVLTIHLRKGLYWFNGSAVMPFTAWDVYAEFYIGIKAFSWFYPFINYSDVDEDLTVVNNYTIRVLFNTWSPPSGST
jgi:ABC-type dipeptide transport system, periplasmic component